MRGASAEAVSEGPSIAMVASEVLFVLGVVVLVSALIAVLALGRRRHRVVGTLAVAGWVASGVGALAVAGQHRGAVGASISAFVSTSLGDAAVVRLLGVGLAYPGVAAIARARRVRRGAGLASAGVAVALLGHAGAGHAAGAAAPRLTELTQAIHVGAVCVWAGGLLAVLVARRDVSTARRRELWLRFGRLAFAAFLLLAVTGAIRALSDAGSLDAFARSTYGRIVLVKLDLLVVLGILAARNRWWHLPRGDAGESAVHRAGRLEAGIAAVAIALSGWLSQEPPPRHAVHALHAGEPVAGHRNHGGEAPGRAASGSGCTRPVDGAVVLVARDLRFSSGCIEVAAGTAFTIRLDNQDPDLHNVAVFAGAAHPQPGDVPIARGELFGGPAVQDTQVPALESGTYHFHCDAHPDMGGTITAVD